MSGFLSAVREKAHFFANSLSEFDTSAAILPSSRALVDAMLAPLPLADAKVVVEFGPGTGAMTRSLLEKMRPDAKLYAIELDPTLHATLAKTITDPRLVAICGDAAEVKQILEKDGHSTCDALLSSLGLSLIPGTARDAIWRGALSVLKPDTVVTQFAYVHAKYVVISPTRGFWRFDADAYLRERFESIEKRYIWPNIPPAIAFTLRQPKRPLLVEDAPAPRAANG